MLLLLLLLILIIQHYAGYRVLSLFPPLVSSPCFIPLTCTSRDFPSLCDALSPHLLPFFSLSDSRLLSLPLIYTLAHTLVLYFVFTHIIFWRFLFPLSPIRRLTVLLHTHVRMIYTCV